MLADLAFFSFVELADESLHGEYNRWHQLDHRPENLALPGVAWGDRWARVRQSTDVVNQDETFSATDFVAMYWFRSPVEESLQDWDRLGEASFQWGRGPMIPGVERKLLAFFRPVKGYAAPRVLVDADVLPYRPNRGIHVTLTKYAQPHGQQAHSVFGWEDRTLMPGLLEVPGVAGGWTFSFSHAQQHSTLPFAETVKEQPGELRIRLLYLDGDPVETTQGISEATARLESVAGAPAQAGEVLFASPLSTITPWVDW